MQMNPTQPTSNSWQRSKVNRESQMTHFLPVLRASWMSTSRQRKIRMNSKLSAGRPLRGHACSKPLVKTQWTIFRARSILRQLKLDKRQIQLWVNQHSHLNLFWRFKRRDTSYQVVSKIDSHMMLTWHSNIQSVVKTHLGITHPSRIGGEKLYQRSRWAKLESHLQIASKSTSFHLQGKSRCREVP